MDARPGRLGSLSALSLEAVHFDYRSGRRGLAGVDLAAAPGERVVVLGPNGAGKSTLVHMLAGLLRPDLGDARILGHEASSAGPALRRRVGVALDRPAHLDALTVAENARLFAHAAGMDARSAAARTSALVRRFGLEEGVPVAELSLGMKRRLLLGEALAHDPELVLLDEPTLGLDPAGVETLGALLAERAAAGGCVLAATNDVRAAPLLGERVVFLLGGRKVADEPVATLLARIRRRTRIEVSVAEVGPWLQGMCGPGAPDDPDPPPLPLRVDEGRLVADSPSGAEPLPELLRWLLAKGARVQGVRVREGDLGDVFRELTGQALEGRGADPDGSA